MSMSVWRLVFSTAASPASAIIPAARVVSTVPAVILGPVIATLALIATMVGRGGVRRRCLSTIVASRL